MSPMLRRELAAVLGLALFAATLGAEFGVMWAWQRQAMALLTQEEGEPGREGPGLEQPGGGEQAAGETPQDTLQDPLTRAGVPDGLWRGHPGEEHGAPQRLVPSGRRARLAIVIDDWGYGWQAAREFLELDVPLTAAVLPNAPYSRQQALQARRRGFEVIVHLPMEPQDGRADPGPGAITTGLSDEEIRRRVIEAIEAVPGAAGVSNHMGSMATADPRVMKQVLEVVGSRGLFFLDSRTTARSVAGSLASAMGVPWAQNQVFLDGEDDPQTVRRQLELAARRALARGEAIAIGHVRPVTARVLQETLPELRRRGIELVPVSALLKGSGRAGDTGSGGAVREPAPEFFRSTPEKAHAAAPTPGPSVP